jgi:RNA polymerase sigma-32 factor
MKPRPPRKPSTKSRRSGQGQSGPKVHEPEVLPAEERPEDESPEEEGEVIEAEPSEEDIEQEARSARLPAVRASGELAADVPDEDAGAVSPTDPLRRYLEEVRRYPLLAPEEEFRLATRLKETGDMSAARALVSANLRLVVKIAFEYRNIYANMLDLIQEGNIGLMKAVSKFDPTKGARLGYYSSWWIRSYILKYLLDNFRLVKIGTTQAQKKLFYHLMREKERLEAQGLLAGPKLLAERLNVREKDVVEMEQRLSGRGAEVSLDAPVDASEKSTSHLEFLADGSEGADDALARDQLLALLKDSLPDFEKTLSEKERRLLNDRLLAEEPKTLQEVADLYGLTRERARQIEVKVIQKLRDFLKSYL